MLVVPPNGGASPIPLLVAFHGATGSARGILGRLGPAATSAGMAVLAVDSRGQTWDVIRQDFGADIEFIDMALARTFDVVNVDPARVAVGGFSDGASYALSLGAINGDLFPRVLAFSPGFMVDGPRAGKPEFFVSHGTEDPILPIDRCSRRLVRMLRAREYSVTYKEFAGGHTVPPEIAREGMAWAVR